MGKKLRRKHVDAALRNLISNLDYDLHKSLECDEDTGEDVYDEYVAQFIREYAKSVGKAKKDRVSEFWQDIGQVEGVWNPATTEPSRDPVDAHLSTVGAGE